MRGMQRCVVGMRQALVLLVMLGVATAAIAASDPAEARPMTAAEAVAAAAASPSGAAGVFEFEIRGSGRDGKWYFLNSMADYRDPGCLTVAIGRGMLAKVQARLGGELDSLHGKRVLVEGTAQRRIIPYTDGRGRRTGGYYYQTHVWLSSPAQIRLADG
jgi:hypothetical protein